MAKKISKVIGSNPDFIRIGKVRLSYVNVFEPNPKTDPPKYTCTLLIDKDDFDTVGVIEDAIDFAEKRGIAEHKEWKGRLPAGYTSPLHDGDKEKPDDPNYAGMYFLNAKNSRKPDVYVRSTDGLSDSKFRVAQESEVYSGCYGAASISFFPYSNSGNKGVGVSLTNIVKLEDGEPLSGGRISVEAAFGDLDD